MAKLVSKTYGEALFELAVEEGKEEEFLQEIESLKEILDANPDFGKLMNHPKILKEEKLKVVEEVFKGHISKELLGFLHIVVAKDRYPEICPDRKSTRLNSSHPVSSRMPSSA